MISTHILDTALGRPASGVLVRLYDQDGQLLGQAQTTDQDGRIKDFGYSDFKAEHYSLEFETASYFEKLSCATFFPKAVIHFSIVDPEQHYHIPLLISPFAYSTYRGS